MNQILESLVALLKSKEAAANVEPPKPTIESFTSRIIKFIYDATSGSTFTRWHKRHAITFEEARVLPERQQKELLLISLGEREYDQLAGRISPKQPSEMTLGELVSTLTSLFDDPRTLFQRRYDTLMAEAENKNVDGVLDEVNIEGDLFEFDKLDLEKFKLLLAALRMRNPKYAIAKKRVLRRFESCVVYTPVTQMIRTLVAKRITNKL